jgi:DNA-binding beta-propeller fold protein YncE
VHVIPGSHRVVPQQLAFAGEHVLLLDKRTLYVFGRNGLVRQQPLPADAVMLDARTGVAVMATSEGTLAASYLGEQPSPSIASGSTFYTKLAAGSDRTYLSGGDTIDIFSDPVHFEKSLRVAGLVDFAASGEALFTLTATGQVTAHSQHGVPYAQITLSEGSDAQMLAVDTAGGAVWVSLSRGCLTGGCQKKTLVLDPATLAITATMTGGVMDVVTSGTRAYALVDLPAELRVLDLTDPLHPAQLAAAAAPESATSLAVYSGRVYVAGDRLYEYAENTLLPRGTHLTAVANPDKAQQVRIDGNCLVLTARGPQPEAYDAVTLAPAAAFELPSNARMVAVQPGRLLILTGHSLEVWSAGAVPPRKRRSS